MFLCFNKEKGVGMKMVWFMVNSITLNKKHMEQKKIAILATNGFEESELASPKAHLESEGWTVHIVSPEEERIKAWSDKDWSKDYKVDMPLEKAQEVDYEGLILPGGVINPDQLRVDDRAIAFIESFFKTKKLIAAICHGPQLLIEAKVLSGRQATSVKNISTDLKNAGTNWVDEEVVVDDNLITSRTPEDLPAFNNAISKYLTQHAKH
jgi:protease I